MTCKCSDEIFRLRVDGLACRRATCVVDQNMNVLSGQITSDGLFDLISNVIVFEEPDSQGQQFHFRIGISIVQRRPGRVGSILNSQDSYRQIVLRLEWAGL